MVRKTAVVNAKFSSVKTESLVAYGVPLSLTSERELRTSTTPIAIFHAPLAELSPSSLDSPRDFRVVCAACSLLL